MPGQKGFCSPECHDLVHTFGKPRMAGDMLGYDYSSYDPEDDKYGGVDEEETGEIIDPEEEWIKLKMLRLFIPF